MPINHESVSSKIRRLAKNKIKLKGTKTSNDGSTENVYHREDGKSQKTRVEPNSSQQSRTSQELINILTEEQHGCTEPAATTSSTTSFVPLNSMPSVIPTTESDPIVVFTEQQHGFMEPAAEMSFPTLVSSSVSLSSRSCTPSVIRTTESTRECFLQTGMNNFIQTHS